MEATTSPYPLRLTGELAPGLSRWLWLVKCVLVIPHVIVLVFLWIAFVVLTVVAFFAILFTGRYPRAIFDFNIGVLRWSWRVGFYSYTALGTDRYPPFPRADAPDYPARLDVEYPPALSRGLVLVKWWLLALPQYVVVGIFVGGGLWLGVQGTHGNNSWAGGGLVGLLVCIAGIVVLFTGRYPRPLYDFILGMDRWVLRVAAYAALMTDRYPPFRMDLGGTDPDRVPGGPAAPAPTGSPAAAMPAAAPMAAPSASGAYPPGRWSTGRVVSV